MELISFMIIVRYRRLFLHSCLFTSFWQTDFSKVGAIHQKRTLAFINHFITNTVSFLNKFSRSCELRLQKFDARVQKLEASLSILEAKVITSLYYPFPEDSVENLYCFI